MALGISVAELARAKVQQRSELAMSRENTTSVASWMGRHLLIYGKYLTLDFLNERIEKVQPEDITRLATQLLKSPPTLAMLGPL